MLNLTREYKLLLRYGDNSLYQTHPQQFPPIPLAPFAFGVLGRLSSLQGVSDGAALIANIQAASVKTALKKAWQTPQASAHPSGQLTTLRPQARTPAELAAVARAAENPFWLPEIQQHVQQHGNAQPCRYIIVDDLLHPNRISRFHFLIKRVQANSTANGQTAMASMDNGSAPAAATSTTVSDSALPAPSAAVTAAAATNGAQPAHPTPGSSPPSSQAARVQYRYYIMDLGSLSGLYIDGIKVRHQLWTPLHEGARLRFAPQTRLAKNYIAAFQAADAANEQRRRACVASGGTGLPGSFPLVAPVLPQMPLSVKDLHIEYLFTHAMNDAAERRVAQLNSVVAATGEVNELLEAAHPSVPVSWTSGPIGQPTSTSAATSSNNDRVSIESDIMSRKRAREIESIASASAIAPATHNTPKRARASTSTHAASPAAQVCPVCRAQHKGAPRQVLSVDNVIEMMVQHNLTPAEKAERAMRIVKADADVKQAAERKAERALDRSMQPVDRMVLGASRSIDAMRFLDDVNENEDSPAGENEEGGEEELPVAPAPQAAAAAAASSPVVVAAAALATAPIVRAYGAQGFSVDLAPNARSKCRTCNSAIMRYAMRLKQHMSSNDKYFHLRCFTNSNPAQFLRGRLAGLDALPPNLRQEAEALI